jgi:hypothetical protein
VPTNAGDCIPKKRTKTERMPSERDKGGRPTKAIA